MGTKKRAVNYRVNNSLDYNSHKRLGQHRRNVVRLPPPIVSKKFHLIDLKSCTK